MKTMTPIQITTGSRLHFGLLSFGDLLERPAASTNRFQESDTDPGSTENWQYAFGGIGLMLQDPKTTITFEPAEKFYVGGDQYGRAETFIRRWHQFVQQTQGLVPEDNLTSRCAEAIRELRVAVQIKSQPPQHTGLGAGTQLALCLAYGLFQYFFNVVVDPKTLALSVGRGLRSAVGTHGFYRGGLIVDRGKQAAGELGILDGHFPIPADWRTVLIQPSRPATAISGEKEIQAFGRLPEIPNETTLRLRNLIDQSIVPAIAAGDFGVFSEGIYQYGLNAGYCFESIQGGPFASPDSQRIVELLRGNSIAGVGQSSWGPTLFAFAQDKTQAQQICHLVEMANGDGKLTNDFQCQICQFKNTGVDVQPLTAC